MGRIADRHAAPVAVTLACLIAVGLATIAEPVAAQGQAAGPSVTGTGWADPPSVDGDGGTPDDTTVPTGLTLTFLPGVASAAGVSGTMDDVTVDARGAWTLPAVCFVADGHVPAGWQAVLGDDAVTLPVATTVCGLVAHVSEPNGATHEVDLVPYVQEGTLALTAVWEPDWTEDRDASTVGTDDTNESSIGEPCYPDAPTDADVPQGEDTRTWDGAGTPDATPDEQLTTIGDPIDDATGEPAIEAMAELPMDEATAFDVVGDETATRREEAWDETIPDDGQADVTSDMSSPAADGNDAPERSGEPVLRAASEEPTEPVTTGDAVAILHGTTLTFTRVEDAPSYSWLGTFTDVLGNAYEGTCYPVSETTAFYADWYYDIGRITRVEVAAGVRIKPKSCNGWFYGASNLVEADLDGLDVSRCTCFSDMFNGCSSLGELDVSGWDVSYSSYFDDAFRGCASLRALDVSQWNTRTSSDLSGLFDGCASLTEIDVSNWNVRRVASTRRMFAGCSSLTSIDLSQWNTGERMKLESASGMFSGCSSLTDLDLGGLNTSKCQNLSSLFAGCTSLESVDLSEIDISAATNLSHLLEGCSSLAEVDLSCWDTSRVTDLSYLLAGCASLTEVDLSEIDITSATNLSHLLEGCTSLTSLDLSPWSTAGVTDLSYLLAGCASLEEVDLTALDTSSATHLEGLLPEGGALASVTLGAPFSFTGAGISNPKRMATMPGAPSEPPHTGLWVLEGTSTAMTASEIAQGYDGAALSGTWVLEVGWAPLALDLAGGHEPTGTDYPQWYRLEAATALPGTPNSDLAAPVRPGFSFAGWADEEGEAINEIGDDSTGTRTLTATWEPLQVHVTVPVALTLAGTPDGEGALSLTTDTDATVTNDGDVPVLVSLALSGAPASLELSVPGDDETVELSASSQEVRTLGTGDALALSGLVGSVDAANVSADTPVATLAWTFAISDTPNDD